MKISYIVNGEKVTEEEFQARPAAESFLDGGPMVSNTYREHDPLVSDGTGVMKHQVGAARDMVKRHNIPGTRVRDSGQVEFTSRAGRREFLRRRRHHDTDGGYGD